MIHYFTKTEWAIWSGSVFFVVLSYLLFDRGSVVTLSASLIGVTSLMFNAKGNPIGQFLAVIFCLIYAYISYTFCYYGELMTYLLMTMPMSLFSLISWLRNPYKGNHSEVTVNIIHKREIPFLLLATVAVTVVFYFILAYFHTANLLVSTFSVTTSFAAMYLSFRRSSLFALAYASNDIVLIVLWVLASLEDMHYLSVVVLFTAFLLNDIYGYINWQKMKRRQMELIQAEESEG